MVLEELYVTVIRISRHLARLSGILALLERGEPNPGRLWIRSLFAIHDVEDLIALDLAWVDP